MKSLFQCGGFSDSQIGMEPLVIDWAKKAKMAKIVKIVRNIQVYRYSVFTLT